MASKRNTVGVKEDIQQVDGLDQNELEFVDGSLSAFDIETAVKYWAESRYLSWKRGKEDDNEEVTAAEIRKIDKSTSGSVDPSLETELSQLESQHLQTVRFDTIWDRVKFRTKEPKFGDKHTLAGDPVKKPKQIVINTKRSENHSKTEQESSFEVYGETESVAEINMKAMILNPVDKTMELLLPDEVQQAGFGSCLKLENVSQKFRETLKWKAIERVKVPAWHEAKVTMLITENQYSSKFEVTTTISGEVRVNVYRKSDNHFLTNITGYVGRIWQYYQENNHIEGLDLEKDVTVVNDKKLKITTAGKAKFIFGVDQDSILTVTKIKK